MKKRRKIAERNSAKTVIKVLPEEEADGKDPHWALMTINDRSYFIRCLNVRGNWLGDASDR